MESLSVWMLFHVTLFHDDTLAEHYVRLGFFQSPMQRSQNFPELHFSGWNAEHDFHKTVSLKQLHGTHGLYVPTHNFLFLLQRPGDTCPHFSILLLIIPTNL